MFVTFGWGVSVFNGLASGKLDVETQWSNIKTEYQRRWDLITNLAESVKSIKNHEKETLVQVIAARKGLDVMPKKSQMKKMTEINGMLSRLMVVVERYPKLIAGEQHTVLMNEIRITEDRINVARTDYNEEVREYNNMIRTFPSNIIAGMFHYQNEEFYKNDEVSDKAPKLNL